jgi:hypothetical protein
MRQTATSNHGFGASTADLTSFLNDAGYLRTIRIERRTHKHRLSILNTKRTVIAFKDHSNRAEADAAALELVTYGDFN